jgi:uncharacterized protein YcfJ
MTMKFNATKTLTLASAALLALYAGAGSAAGNPNQSFNDRGRVISSTPVYEEINQPRRECWTERVTESRETVRDRSVGGALIGGLAGGILGHQVGKGSGRKAATIVGAATGAIVGDRIDNDGDRYAESRAPRDVEHCRSVDNWSRKVSGYDVIYRYGGQEYRTFLPYDPGSEIKLRVNVSVDENW